MAKSFAWKSDLYLEGVALRDTSITNKTWREACAQGKIDVAKVSKLSKEKVVLAQWALCSFRLWESYDHKLANHPNVRGLDKLTTQLQALSIILDAKFSELSKDINDINYPIEILSPVLAKFNDLKQTVATAKPILERRAKVLGSENSRRVHVFENWVWCVASAYQEGGGEITLTVKEAADIDAKARYEGGLYLFALRIMRDEEKWPLATAPSAFGAALARALKSLRQRQITRDGRVFVKLAKSTLLSSPT